jgi:Putative beta-barrel porin-2, OmpL-like. bbp2
MKTKAAEPAAPGASSAPATTAASAPSPAPAAQAAVSAPDPQSSSRPPIGEETTTKSAPFGYADWTWMNGTPRNKDTPLATKYFTPEFRADANYIEDYNQPKDHTMGGATESFRNGEVQLEQMSFGGDLRVDNVRGRVLTMFGLFATTTPRNDGSYGVGQWDLRGAYKYVSEAWGGYHFNVNHGLNVDAGIFVSYIGLFSYYNFDNWAYQPSYVSSNTPWFFNGVRIQWFPTDKLKIEPWIINGWQSYAKFNGHPGLGGQILWRPKQWVSIVSNNYGMGTDTLGVPGRSRIHTDNSIEVKYFDHPENYGLDKMAFSLTGDLGCEYGGSGPGTIVSCHNNSNGHPKQMFAGWMLYDRAWFHHDLFGVTVGGGKMNNPGRYLTLLPPINGADAVSGSPYFQGVPGSKFEGWDSTVTFDYMPRQFLTFRFEGGYRYANVPYWTGRQGITPPGANYSLPTTNPADYICANGHDSGIGASGTGNPADDYPTVEAACGGPVGSTSAIWVPDLRKGQWENTIAIMVKF